MDELAYVLESVFGSEVRTDAVGTHTIVRSGDAFFPVRIRTSPVAELFVTTRPLDGFELELRCEYYTKGAPFDDAFTVDTNDSTLSRLWLDEVTKSALVASVYQYETSRLSLGGMLAEMVAPLGWREPVKYARSWTYELSRDRLWATKGGVEHHADRLILAVRTAAAFAARSHRWAAEYAALVADLDVTVRSEVELGRDRPPLITTTRNAVEIGMRLLRCLPDRGDRLRSLVTAPRLDHDGSTFSLLDEELPRAARPPMPKGEKHPSPVAGFAMRATGTPVIDDTATKLFAVARPVAVTGDLDSVDVWFDGALMECDRIDAAFTLAAHLAIASIAPQGPYR